MSTLRNRSITPALAVLAVVLVTILVRPTGYLQPVEDAIHTVLAPLQYGLSWVSGEVGRTVETVRQLDTLQDQVRELQQTVDRLMIENVRLHDAEIELGRLRELLQFRQANPTFEMLAAEVIGRDSSNLLEYLLIDRGTQDGVALGMPVVTNRGLVGRITMVYPHSARVMLLTDVASSVSALIQSSRATGVVQGQGRRGLILQYLEQGEQVQIGDIVLTSGLGSNFPKRLVIGQVTEAKQTRVDMFQEVLLQSAVAFDRLESVLVIQSFAPSDETP